MIFGAHVIVYSTDEGADREFFRDVLGLSSVDVGHGWLIFALPPAEVAVHPTGELPTSELYLMCDDLDDEMRKLAALGVACAPVEAARWGSLTYIPLPGGARVGLYEPRHATAFERE